MLIFFLVALGASAVGAICGIGGGVIIKPVHTHRHNSIDYEYLTQSISPRRRGEALSDESV